MVYRSSLCIFSIIGLLALGLNGCTQQNATNKGNQKGGGGRGGGGNRQTVNVKTATLQRISVQRAIDVSGTLVSPDQARVSGEVAGVVREVLVEIGQEVGVGQELVRLDTTELKLALDRAESALRQTEAQLGIDPARDQVPSDDQIAVVRTAA